MGKIRKIASQKHEATISPFVAEQVKIFQEVPVYQLPATLAGFPRPWPFPRGDLYHWIPVLNRFDDLLQGFIATYHLREGPQTTPFSCKYILKGEKDSDHTQENVLDQLGMPHDADKVLVESVLDFTLLLYENCANRSLYASSAHLDDLLNTTSLSLLTLVLRLSFRLAQRYTQERLRVTGGGHLQHINATMLAQHYLFDLNKMEKLAQPFVKSLHPGTDEAATIKDSEKGTSVSPVYAPSLLSLVQDTGSGPGKWQEYGSPWLSYLSEGSAPTVDSPPASPSPGQRPSAHNGPQSSRHGLKLLEIPSEQLAQTDIHSVLKAHLPSLPKSAHYELLCRLRNASALADSADTRRDIVSIRMLAISNLASIYPESQLQATIFQHEAEEARRSHMPHQLCDLLHPPGKDSSAIPRSLQTMAMRALESFANHRLRSHEVLHAIGYNVNHGVLTYLVRKAVTDLSVGESESETVEEADWFAALFDLLHCLPRSVHRLGDALSSAGLLDAFVQALKLKTRKADQERHRFLTLLDIFVYNSREAFTALVNSGGLDAFSELMEREVHSALKATQEGDGLPPEWKTPMTFSKINFMQQQTLRNLFKVLKNMISMNIGPFDRVLRNLIESSQLLGALKQVIEHPSIYGSNVWCGAVEIFTNFIHNEPTSYAAIAEAGLAKAVLDTVNWPTDPISGKHGVLPTSEAVLNIPLAFGAICLTENGMKTFQESNAMNRFFDILLDFARTKSLANSANEAETWGAAFDELARHHPSLKPYIMQKIVDLTVNLRDFIAKQKFYGSLTVISGTGNITPEVAQEDQDMNDDPSPIHTAPATPVETINVVTGFLNGVFRNTSLCTSFSELGGVQALVDVAATAVLHSDQVLQFCQGPITKTVQTFVHHKAHLILPLLMNRLRETLSSAASFIEGSNEAAVFSPYISSANLKARSSEDEPSDQGSPILADLLVIRNLTHMLTRSFAENSHRSSHPVSQVNLSDLYVELVGILGKLQSRCMVEYMLLQDMASAQDAGSRITGSALDAAQDYRATFMSKSDQVQHNGVTPEEPINQATELQNNDGSAHASSEEARGAAKQNFKVICSVISRIPTDVAWFFSAVGKAILLRRLTNDAYNKQCVFAVATGIAKAVVSVLDCTLPESMSPKLVDYYHRSSITCTSIAMIEKTRESGMQPLTLVLWKFKQAAGYDSLTRIGQVLLAHAQLPSYSDTEESRSRGPTWAVEGLRNLTVFLGRSTSNKDITEAPQTQALTSSTRDSQRTSPDHFSSGQFLVELRSHVLRFILPIWNSDTIARMHAEFVKAVCSILQLILSAESEAGSYTRQDQPPVQSVRPHRTMNVASSENLNHLARLYDHRVAEEALFRCNNQRTPAQEYCELRQRHSSVQRFPIPEQDLPAESERHPGTSNQGGGMSDAQESVSADSDAQDMLRRVVESLPASVNQQSETPQTLPASDTGPSTSAQVEQSSLSTIEDLDELRAEVRADLVDRCIFVLHTFEKLSFNIADLIIAGTSKAADPAGLRADISATLVQSLVSYAGTDEDLREQREQFASSAHLLGVILQDKDWFTAAQDFLAEDFDTFSQFLSAVPADQSESITWLANVLLIVEKVLAEEAQPRQIQWIPPNPDEPTQEARSNDKIVDLRTPLISLDSKKELFERLIALMPRVGKDTTLGTAIVRVLVSLTRNRACADLLSARKNLQRLFMMIKQLSIVSDRKFHGNVMVVLRQIVEDETVIRQIMRTEIQAYFDKHSPRGVDTTIYTRQLFHLVLRDPEAFVEVTNELVMLSRFDRNQTPQQLVLKSAIENLNKALEDKVLPSNGNNNTSEVESSDKAADATKSVEAKAPLLERNDGITSFILSELLAYRDVPDSLAPKLQSSEQDVVMTGADALASESSDQSNPTPTNPKDSKSEDSKDGFKSEEHPIFVYRCFLLQTLTELLQAYNCCKLNFINYSRKAEPQVNTPSKPRSGVLYYLLNSLVPTGTLQHVTDDKSKMTGLISYWATHVVVALCAKTNERRDVKRGSSEETDSILLHIRRFVLEHTLKAYKETNTTESPEAGLSRLLCLADLCNKMLAGKPNNGPSRLGRLGDNPDDYVPTQKQIARIMFEKSFIPALTSSLADIDANIPGANRAVKHILAPLKLLTHTAIELSMSGEASSSSEPGASTDEDEEVSSATSASDRAGGREETPDLFRNSTLGMFEPGREDIPSSGSSSEEDEEDMYGDAYADDMEYDMEDGDEIQAAGPDDDAVSDEDMDGMGPVEGIDGDVPMDMEIELEDENDDDDNEEDSMDEDVSDDDEEDDDEVAEIIEEISGDDENASLAEDAAADDWRMDNENIDYGVDGEDEDHLVALDQLDEEDHLGDPDDQSEYDGNPLDIVDTTGGAMPFREGDDIVASDEDGLPHPHDDDEASEDDEDEDDDEDDEIDDDDPVYESLGDYEEDEAEAHPFAWGWPPPGRRQLHRHVNHMPYVGSGSQDRDRLFMPGFRNYRNPGQSRGNDDDTNPLLNRQRRPNDASHGASVPYRSRMGTSLATSFGTAPSGPAILARLERDLLEGNDTHISQTLMNIMHGHTSGLQVTMRQLSGGMGDQDEMREYVVEPNAVPSLQNLRHHDATPARREPASAVEFEPSSTENRWQESARILFGSHFTEKSAKIINALLKLLVPPAIERDRERRRKQEEDEKKREEQRAKERAEREEREARERKEEEERRAKEAEDRRKAEAEAAEAAEAAAQAAPTAASEAQGDAMDISEERTSGLQATEQEAEQVQSRPRVVTQIRGRELDITDLGIDLSYIEALPEEVREEVIMQQYTAQRSTAAATGEEPTTLNEEFLDALPADIRAELLQQEASERRRREREEQRRRQQAEGGNAPHPEDIDTASVIAALDPILRREILAEGPEDLIDSLPPDLAAEARALGSSRSRHRLPPSYLGSAEPPSYLLGSGGGGRGRHQGDRDGQPKPGDDKPQRRPIVQMVDKSGIATLLRLMFLTIPSTSKWNLNAILTNACGNRQTRAEVVNGLLSILQDGSADLSSIERCFSQLTLRAKQGTSTSKTPQSSKKQASPVINMAADATPHLVIGQCIGALLVLATGITTVPQFFLTEHEVVGSFKPKTGKKGKAKETRATKYPLMALLALLERDSVLANSSNMEQLSELLAVVTRPLADILKKSDDETSKNAKTESNGNTDAPSAQSATSGPGTSDSTDAQAASSAPADATARAESTANEQAKDVEAKKHRSLAAPDIPAEALKPVVNILLARECSSQTFRNTITMGTNLSAIDNAKEVFKEELMKHARILGSAIQKSLAHLIQQLGTVETDMQAQSVAMADFSPNGSDQTKLSRIITALDYFYDPDTHTADGKEKQPGLAENSNDLLRLFEDATFVELWSLLSKALDATKRSETDYYFNVATILLPLIEALLVVCKRVPLKEKKSDGQGAKMRNIFFAFTNSHKKVLNDLVRQNPKLMNANFSVLVKNSGVLEFDNKRSYFSRRLHHRTGDMRQYPHQTLQLNVRREQVFLDSYKGLHYKTPKEIKYGKLNIRFHNEEGVDAGGVTREWFQVLARQMFNPDYALFNPVASDRTTFHPNSLSAINPEHLHFFKFIGRIIGKALYENRVLDCHFSRAVYKKILGQPVTMKDMETVDLDYSKNISWMLNNNITDILTETFSISQDQFGVEEIIDLIPDGRNVAVTEENKHDFVRRVIDYRLTGSVQEQLDSFLSGFYDIVPLDLISIFDEGELELLISGMPDIDVDDWKANTDYHNYNASSPQIQWFWRAVRSFDKEEQAKLLQFVTGTGKVPLNGFKELEGMNGFTRFSIHKDFSSKDRLPSSHTCFNQLDLPEYDNYESLRKNLYTAMTTGNEYFGYA